MAKSYNENLTKLKIRRSRIIAKRIELRRQDSEHIPLKQKIGIVKKIAELSKEMDKIEKEVKQIEKGMQNRNNKHNHTINNI